jgi:hypothetical protein
MSPDSRVVFLLDVDNTLLENDHVIADLMRHLEHAVGQERTQRYWVLLRRAPRADYARQTIPLH